MPTTDTQLQTAAQTYFKKHRKLMTRYQNLEIALLLLFWLGGWIGLVIYLSEYYSGPTTNKLTTFTILSLLVFLPHTIYLADLVTRAILRLQGHLTAAKHYYYMSALMNPAMSRGRSWGTTKHKVANLRYVNTVGLRVFTVLAGLLVVWAFWG